ncbi:MAG: hypothetical protein DRR06_13325 [Gammaproteobacteria bacterium]|nr:MAG: hypothetical protein DRR06_13325 [Gammaproteobacteria bacterium]
MYTTIPPNAIIAWVSKNFEFKLKKQGAEYHICSPFDDDNAYKFCINPDKGLCHDWRGDEWAGPITKTGKRNCSVVRFVMLYRKCSYPAALKELLGVNFIAADYKRPISDDTEDTMALPDGVEPLTGSTNQQAAMLIKWLKNRGYTDRAISQYDLHFIGMQVYWPYYESDELMYWQARSRVNKRFLFPDVPKHFLYGFDEIDPLTDNITLVEGIFDKQTLGPTTLAVGGAILNDTQIKKIRLLRPKRIILAPDNDEAGARSVRSNYQRLQHPKTEIYTRLPPSLPYTVSGEQRHTKDFNELFTAIGMSIAEIRALFPKHIRKYRP